MPVYVPSVEAVWLRNPKCASSSLVRILRERYGAYTETWRDQTGHSSPGAEQPDWEHWCSVRNPYDRMVSGFLYWEHPYETLYDWLTGKPHLMVDVPGEQVDIKSTPQSHWYRHCPPENIMRVEDPEPVWTRWQGMTGYWIPLPHHNVGTVEGGRELIDPQSQELIEERFKTDFEDLGYDMAR